MSNKLTKNELHADLVTTIEKVPTLEQTLTTHEADDIKHNISVKVSKTNKDANGIFTTVEYRRKSDNTLYQKSILSGGTSPNYSTRTITYYGTDGTTIVKTETFSISYDADDDFISEV